MRALSADPILNAMCSSDPLIFKFDEAKALAESFTESSLRAYLLQQQIDCNEKQAVIRDEWNKNKHKHFTRDSDEPDGY